MSGEIYEKHFSFSKDIVLRLLQSEIRPLLKLTSSTDNNKSFLCQLLGIASGANESDMALRRCIGKNADTFVNQLLFKSHNAIDSFLCSTTFFIQLRLCNLSDVKLDRVRTVTVPFGSNCEKSFQFKSRWK